MPMHNPIPTVWQERIAALPYPEPLAFRLQLNTEREHLSCIVCGQGADERWDPTEWLVHMRSPEARMVKGLHEECRRRNVGTSE